MCQKVSRSPKLRMLLLAAGLTLLASSSAQAEVGDDCTEWTLFPDFRCEDRSARPKGSFNPVGMPFLFEDPHITTGLNFVYVYHSLPSDGPVGPAFDGGSFQVVALQIRLAVTDKLAFIATKDGFPAIFDPGENSAVRPATEVLDMTLGFKYALFETEDRDFIVTPALRYEIPLGSKKVFQGYGDGVMIPSASFRWGMKRFGFENANVIGSLGGQIPIDSARNSDSIFYNIHLDYGFEIDNRVVKFIVPFFEMNGLYYTGGGNGTNPIFLSDAASSALGVKKVPLSAAQAALGTGPFEGVDVANLGSTGIAGESVFVLGGGVRVPMAWGLSAAAMYEGAVSGRKDLWNGGRFTFMLTWEM